MKMCLRVLQCFLRPAICIGDVTSKAGFSFSFVKALHTCVCQMKPTWLSRDGQSEAGLGVESVA